MLFRFILCDKCYLTCKIRKTTVGLGKKQKSKQCYFLTSKCIYFCHRRYTFRTQHAEITARTGGTLLTIWGLASSPVSHYYLVAPLQSLHSLAVMHRSLHMIFSLVTSLPFSSLKHHLCSPVCTAFLQLLHNLPFKVSLLYYLCQVTCFFGDPCSLPPQALYSYSSLNTTHCLPWKSIPCYFLSLQGAERWGVLLSKGRQRAEMHKYQ